MKHIYFIAYTYWNYVFNYQLFGSMNNPQIGNNNKASIHSLYVCECVCVCVCVCNLTLIRIFPVHLIWGCGQSSDNRRA